MEASTTNPYVMVIDASS